MRSKVAKLFDRPVGLSILLGIYLINLLIELLLLVSLIVSFYTGTSESYTDPREAFVALIVLLFINLLSVFAIVKPNRFTFVFPLVKHIYSIVRRVAILMFLDSLYSSGDITINALERYSRLEIFVIIFDLLVIGYYFREPVLNFFTIKKKFAHIVISIFTLIAIVTLALIHQANY